VNVALPVFDFGVHRMLMRSSSRDPPSSDDRASVDEPSELAPERFWLLSNASRISIACSTETPKLPVIVNIGIAAQKSTFKSALPSATNQSINACAVFSIHLVVHQLIRGSTKDGCTRVR
jgi:hypothetical protein